MRTTLQPVQSKPALAPAANALFGKARMAALAALFAEPGSGLHLREIARRGSVAPAAMMRELELLLAAGVLLEERQGNLRLFRVNAESALARPLGELAQTLMTQATITNPATPANTTASRSMSSASSSPKRTAAQRKSRRLGLSVPHDWSNSAMPDDALIARTAASLRFADVMRLCAHYGLAEVRRVVETDIVDPLARAVLTRQLKNIEAAAKS